MNGRIPISLFGLVILTATALSSGASSDEHQARVETARMQLEFDSGWLTRWRNLEMNETVDFGKPQLAGGAEDRHYVPGPWWVDWKQPDRADKASWQLSVSKVDDTAAVLQQSAELSDGEIHAVQWGVQVPYEQIQAVHWPRGLAPARLSGNGYPESMITKNYEFNGRLAMLAGGSSIRHRYYVIQAKRGGLLIYMDDPQLDHHMAMEFKKPSSDKLIISNRSILPPPWKSNYTGGRWVFRQYNGQVNVAAQIYQDYLAEAYHIVPLEKRPTAWIKDLAFVQVNDMLRGPAAAPGFRAPNQDYLSGEAWEKSLVSSQAWLDKLATIVPPEKYMFYLTDWRQDGMDLMFPTTDVDPYFAMIVGKARKMGFHVMLHMHNHLVHANTTFWRRYIEYPAILKNQDPAKDLIEGVGVDALRNKPFVSRNKEWGTAWDARKGLPRVMDGYHINPAHGGIRYMMVANILSAIRATGADALHLDVPNIWVDLRGEVYGMNQMQGQREFYKLLRQTLDDNGFAHVAIATELTPFEGFMRYVDASQNSRDASTRTRADGIERGSTLAGEDLIALQSDKDLEELLKARQPTTASSQKTAPPNPQAEQKLLSLARDLGEPSIDNMVIAPYIQSYPHLGAYPGNSPLAQRLSVWYGFTHDVMPHSGSSYDFDQPTFPMLEFGKLAVSRFIAAEGPRLVLPREWEDGDVARYRLRDGRILRVTRADASTLRLAFADGQILGELDLLVGWKNCDVLFSKYGPEALRAKLR